MKRKILSVHAALPDSPSPASILDFCSGRLCSRRSTCAGFSRRLRMRPPCKRKRRNQELLRAIVRLHQKYPCLGLDSIYHILKCDYPCSRGRVHRLMKHTGIHSIRKAGFKAATNSRHKLPIAPNLLIRNFHASKPDTVWVSDIT